MGLTGLGALELCFSTSPFNRHSSCLRIMVRILVVINIHFERIMVCILVVIEAWQEVTVGVIVDNGLDELLHSLE